MFIVIFEDGIMHTCTEIIEELKKDCDDGYLEIIDITGEIPKQYYDGQWRALEELIKI